MSRKLEVGLTPREWQVARLVRGGLTDRDIAGRLSITRRTAEWHVKQILNKLGFNSRSQVAAWVAQDEAVGSIAGSSNGHRHNLPLQLTTFVGRGNELAELQRLLAAKRFVTLTAVGGAGKTRLALEVADRALGSYPDGAWLIDLTPIKDGHLVAGVFGSTLGVHERPRQPIAETLLEHLRRRHLLLVVDNCEHVIEDCAGLVDTILRSCPGVTLLATSREPLRVSGETIWRVAPLAVPDSHAVLDLSDLAQYEAVGLFLDRAQLAAPGFDINAENAFAIAQLCRRLDGIPLSIELAAARAGSMSPDQILNRLENRFALLTGGSRAGPARHRTLQSALDWSHDLLRDEERRLFRRLSVFAGGFSLEAVEQVCCDHDLEVDAIAGLLGSLVDKSLVVAAVEGSAPIRFRMLETLQQYGQARLAEHGEVERLNRSHSEFFVALARETAPKLRGREQQVWHRRLAQDVSNLRLALQWTSGREPDANLRLIIALTGFWYIAGLVEEGDGWLERALVSYSVRNRLRAEALAQGGLVSYWRDYIDSASARWHECLEIYCELDDREGVGQGLRWVGELKEWQGDLEEARRCFDGSLAIATEAEDDASAADIRRQLGRLAMKEGDHEKARTYLEESLTYHERIGDLRLMNIARGYLGLNAIDRGDFAAARSHLEEGLAIGRVLDFTIGVATPLMYFAALAAAQGHPSRALRLSGASDALAASVGGVATQLTRPLVERWLDKSRLELGPTRSEALWGEGRAMSREQAIEYALKGLNQPRRPARRKSAVNRGASKLAAASFITLVASRFVAEPLRPGDIHAIRMLADPAISPNGDLVAVTVLTQDPDANEQRSAIWVVPADGSAPPRQLTRGPRRDHRPRFSPDGKRLAFLANREKEWRNDLYILDLAGGEPTRTARLPRGILEFDWSPDGRRMALLGRPDWPKDPDMPQAKDDEETRKRYQERVRHLVRRFRYRMDGLGQLDDEEPQVWVVDTSGESGGLRQVTHGPWPAARPRWAPDGRIAYLANHADDWWRSEFVDIWTIDPEVGEPERLTTGGATVTTFAFAPGGTLAYVAIGPGPGSPSARNHRLFVAGEDRTAGIDRSVWAGVMADMLPPREVPELVWTDDGDALYTSMTDRGRIYVDRVAAGGGPPEPVLSGDRVIPAFSLGGGRLAFLSTSHDDPLTLRIANADGSEERVLFEPNPWIRKRALGQVRVMDFGHEGRAIDAWVLLPPGYAGGRVPAILNIHGGPHAAWGWSFSHVMQTLAGQGYAVLFCNSPGSQTYTEEYSVCLTGRWGELDFPVSMALVDKAIAGGIADPERLGVTGASYGGYSTLWVIGHTDRFQAAISMRPVSDLQAFYGSSDIAWNFGHLSFGAEPWEDPDLFRRLSPVTYVDRMTTPLRIIASTGDLRTPLEEAEQVYVRLLKLGREVDLVIFHGEPHSMTVIGKPWNRVRHMRAVLEWWERYLRVPATPASARETMVAT